MFSCGWQLSLLRSRSDVALPLLAARRQGKQFSAWPLIRLARAQSAHRDGPHQIGEWDGIGFEIKVPGLDNSRKRAESAQLASTVPPVISSCSS